MSNQEGPARLGRRAVVVGAGMGGMMAAEVLSRFFEEIVVLDKDVLPAAADPRRDVPQGAHAHALMIQGRRNLEKIFPGLTSELIDRGAVCSRAGSELCIRDEGGWQTRRDLHLLQLTMSRPLLEGAVRDFLRRNPRVTIRDATPVEGWRFEGDRLSGVTVRGARGDEAIAADLVIDATGRSGNPQSWLEAGGFAPVEETRLEIGTGYASAIFRKPPGWQSAVDSMVIFDKNPDTRAGFIFSIENEHWIASLIGRFEQQPPGDPEKFLAFAKDLCEPDLYNWISQGERITPIKVYKAPVSRWRHYERLTRFPDRILPVGDAYAHVNPVYGQGMTLASIHVLTLWDLLAQRAATGGVLDGLARPYFERVHAFTKGVWEGLENLDYGYACTKGDRPADIDMRMAFTRALRKLTDDDPELHALFIGIANLIHPVEAAMRPDIVGRVMTLLAAEAAG
ncbi:MAG: FAD-dependent monooxygenase [Rhizomicrobium sp.]